MEERLWAWEGGGELTQATIMVQRNWRYISILGSQELAVCLASNYFGTIPVVSHMSYFGAEGIKPFTSSIYFFLGSAG